MAESSGQSPNLSASPLAEALPNSLDEIFSTDPERFNPANPEGKKLLEAAVAAYRAKREDWLKAEAAGATKAPKGSAAKLDPAAQLLRPTDLGL